MRKLLLRLTALAAALSAGTLTGCTAGQFSSRHDAGHAVDHLVDEIRHLPGVDDARVEITGTRTEIYSLHVTVADDITADDLASVGAEAADFADEIRVLGMMAGDTEIVIGDSTFSYFDSGAGDDLAEQLGYWLELQRASTITAVQMSGYSTEAQISPTAVPRTATPAPDSATPSPTEPSPRYIALELPEGTDAAAAADILGALRAIADPGAPRGRWDVTLPSEHLTAEFLDAKLPLAQPFRQVMGVADSLRSVDGIASVALTYRPAANAPLNIEVASFDDAMSGVDAARAEAAFVETELWRQLDPMMAALSDDVNYRVEVLANTLADGGNFKLSFSVNDCEFTGDARWPKVSQQLGEVWQRGMRDSRASCQPTIANLP